MIKGIVFDLDGVYFINGKSNFIKEVFKLGVPENEIIRVFLKSDQMNKLYKTGKMTDKQYWEWAANEWKIDKSPQELIDLLISGYETNPSVVNYLKKIKKVGYKTLACSNNFPARIEGLHKKFNFLDNFDTHILSYEVGYTKPNQKIFRVLIHKSGLQANQIVFVDDKPNNISQAKDLGINAFLFKNLNQFKKDLVDLNIDI